MTEDLSPRRIRGIAVPVGGALLALGLLLPAVVHGATLFSDGFETRAFVDGGWSVDGRAKIDKRSAYAGRFGARIWPGSSIEVAVTTVGYVDVRLQLARRTQRMDAGEALQVEWFDGAAWHLAETTRDRVWRVVDLPLGPASANNGSLRLRLHAASNSRGEYARVDEVAVVGTVDPSLPPPATVTSPSPGDGAAGVAEMPVLTWAGGDGATAYRVYFGPGPLLGADDLVDEVTDPLFVPGLLDAGATYSWRVDAVNAAGATPGATWTFTVRSEAAWDVLLEEDFESGWGLFAPGGRDARLHTGGTHARGGVGAADIQDNSGLASSFALASPIDLSGPYYAELALDFWYKPVSMDNAREDFLLEVFDGATWSEVARWVKGVDFTNGSYHRARVPLDPGVLSAGAFDLRFRCDASGNGDDVYIDDIRLLAIAPDAEVRVEAVQPFAFEKEREAAVVAVRRDLPGSSPLRVPFELAGPADPTKGAPDLDDFLLEGADGAPLDGSVTIPAGETEALIVVQPVVDDLAEVPEQLRVVVPAGPGVEPVDGGEATVILGDARPTPDNDRLFVAPLFPQDGAITTADGVSTLLLQGDNATAVVNVTFRGLTSLQTAAHIHVADPVSGPHVESLPLGQIEGHLWEIRAAHFLATDQAVLDALLSGRIYVNVHSGNYPAGEIRGDYREQVGAGTFTPPPDAPPVAPLEGLDLDRDLVRFLNQATFGATPAALDDLRARVASLGGDRLAAMSAWIDEQMDAAAVGASSTLDFTLASGLLYGSNYKDRRSAWWTHARYAPDQLRQRMAFALSEILVTSEADGTLRSRERAMAAYYDLLVDGAFGRYRDLLEDVTLSPVMGRWLSHLRNQKEVRNADGVVTVSPDENYAREIMQLFTFGLFELHPDGSLQLDAGGLPIATYDNDVITEMSKVFTGLAFSQRLIDGAVVENTRFGLGNGNSDIETRWMAPMKMFEDRHDTTDKVIFRGHVLPGSRSGLVDIADTIDLLAAHPSTAPFLSRLLIQRLVTSNPSRGYVYRVAAAYTATGGDLGAVIKAILLDHDARSLALLDSVGHGRVKEPLVRFTALLRLLGGGTRVPLSELGPYGYPTDALARLGPDASIIRMGSEYRFGQIAQASPTVFNFFLPDFVPQGPLAEAGMAAPEMQITTEIQIFDFINQHNSAIINNNGLGGSGSPPGFLSDDDNIRLDLSELQALHDDILAVGTDTEAVEAVVDHLDLFFNAGELRRRYGLGSSDDPRGAIVENVAATSPQYRIKSLVYLMAVVPQTAVQK